MRAVLISIQPKYVELIASGKKTIEVRKSRPKLEVPFKCYIYCTLNKKGEDVLLIDTNGENVRFGDYRNACTCDVNGKVYCNIGNGNVIGEFVCDRIVGYYPYGLRGFELSNKVLKNMCLSNKDLNEYGKLDRVYGWHISQLKIYDKPKELREFKHWKNYNMGTWVFSNLEEVKRPPKSWSYVEDLGV